MTSNAPVISRVPLTLMVPAVLVAALSFVPIAVICVRAGQAGLSHAIGVLARPLVGRLLLNTVLLVAAATIVSAALGTGCAWFLERTRVPGSHMWSVLVAVPLAIPAFVTSYAWVSISPGLQDFAGALLVVTFSYYPLVYLPVAAALRNLDPALEETARSLGCSPWRCFTRVALPHLRPALYGGMLLVALNVLVEFGAFALLRYRTFTTEIYAEYRTGFAGPEAALLAFVLLAFCLIFLLTEARVRGTVKYARLGSGSRRVATRHDLGWAKLAVLFGFVALAAVSVGVPLGTIMVWLMQHAAAATSPVQVSPWLLVKTTIASLSFGVAAAVVTVPLALPLGILASRYAGRRVALLERVAYLPQGVPGIVIGLALVTLTVHFIRPLYQSATLLVLAYAILFLPLALVGVRASLTHVQPALEDAGRSLGLSGPAMALRVILPLAGPGLAAAAALVFISSLTELTTTLLLAPIGTQTLAMEVWSDTSTLAFAAAAPYAAILMALSLASTWLLARRFGRSALLGSV